MKDWNTEQWVKFMLAAMVFICLTTYFVGAMVLKQETNEINVQLRIRIVDLLSFIAAQLLIDKKNSNDKKNEEK